MQPKSLEFRNLSVAEKVIAMGTELAKYADWEGRYKFIIELGKQLAPMPVELKTEEAKVRGCQSQVWLQARLSPDHRLQLLGDSDALIVKGLVASLFAVYDNSDPGEVLKTSPKFLRDWGLLENLSRSRANGLAMMIQQIQRFAIAFEYAK